MHCTCNFIHLFLIIFKFWVQPCDARHKSVQEGERWQEIWVLPPQKPVNQTDKSWPGDIARQNILFPSRM